MRFTAKMDLEKPAQSQLGPCDIVEPGAFGKGKKTAPLYWGEVGDPNRRIIGEIEIDLETGEGEGTIESPEKMAALDAQIELMHGPGAVAALDAAIADGSIFSGE